MRSEIKNLYYHLIYLLYNIYTIITKSIAITCWILIATFGAVEISFNTTSIQSEDANADPAQVIADAFAESVLYI